MTKDYGKNLKPIVNAPAESTAFNKTTFRQGDMNKTPMTSTVSSKSAFSLLKNKVSNADSARLQNASKLPGRVSDTPCKAPFA